MTISKDGVSLTDLGLWEELGGPKRKSQWVAGRSAMEVARAWIDASAVGRMPAEVEAALAAHLAFGPVLEWRGEPEVKLSFDTFRGEPRNTDMLIHARDQHGNFAVAVEGKADESFGETIGEALGAALERQLDSDGRSKGIKRIQQLVAALFKPRTEGQAKLEVLRYQLLTATAGALRAAPPDVTRVVLLVHEFVTTKTVDEKHQMNSRDLDLFLRRLSQGAVSKLGDRGMVGPFHVPGGPLFNRPLDLYVAKAIRKLR